MREFRRILQCGKEEGCSEAAREAGRLNGGGRLAGESVDVCFRRIPGNKTLSRYFSMMRSSLDADISMRKYSPRIDLPLSY
jgi:hypothetical protein